MKIYLASDHGGYYLKEELKSYLSNKGYQVKDFGAFTFNANDDYPDFVLPLAEELAKKGKALGIILGRSGNGEVIAANKVKGVYGAHCVSVKMAKRARQHNDANIIALGAEYTTPTAAKRIVDAFISTPFSRATRHTRRIKKITKYESTHCK